jgi:predicted transcriptional regulator
LPVLGELEAQVLAFLWKTDDADVGQVHAAVGTARGITLNTVGSALERLHRKGLVTRVKVSHAFRYRHAVEASEFAARRVVEAAGGVRKLASVGLLSAFVDLVSDADEQALDRLEKLIAAKRATRRGA